ncbi:unnamed protein product [Adineta steineri]|uniref:Peptidase S1 domain-containing protein n=1 Tax=Adineta steineri TaxID=433720 RepID=A0A815UKM7_9BILA|nr:unnamed protein product [Adineta steineri]CAF1518908.1 unnamed protein product [Adineta steineri]
MALSTLCLLLFLSLTDVINGAGNCIDSSTVSVNVPISGGCTQGGYRQSVIDYWTPERMASAKPMQRKITIKGNIPFVKNHKDNEIERILTPSTIQSNTRGAQNPPASGRVFFNYGNMSYSCSGSVVTANNTATVVTAGHCVYDNDTKQWATNWIFVPDYNNGSAPYGIFTARILITTPEWKNNANFSYDVALAIMCPNNGTHIQTKVGGGFTVSLNASQTGSTIVRGYPGNMNNAQTMSNCTGSTTKPGTALLSPFSISGIKNYDGFEIYCTMGPGSSGGPWVRPFNSSTSLGLQVSGTSFGIVFLGIQLPYLYGPRYQQSNIGKLMDACQSA